MLREEPNVMSSTIPPATIQAYRETLYLVHGRDGFIIQVGQRNARLSRLIAEYANGAAFVTAFNPFSIELSERENRQRQHELRQVLISMRLHFLEGAGQHPSGAWQAEDSVLVLGTTLQQARCVAAQFGQNAIVWADRNQVPHLELLR